MKLFFAAPLSGLPSELTAFGSHASRLHFVIKLFFAAPASALPSLLTALLSHVPCAAAEPIANADTTIASMSRFICPPSLRRDGRGSLLCPLLLPRAVVIRSPRRRGRRAPAAH